MIKMSWTHSSKLIAVGALLAIALGMAGTAAAVSFDDSGVPDAVEVGEQEEITVTMTEPFEDQPDQWTLAADTELDGDVTITTTTVGGQTEQHTGEVQLNSDDAINEVEITASGAVPAIESYNYEDKDEENIAGVEVSGDIESQQWDVHRYTDESREARQKIDEAAERVGSDNEDLSTAISLYNSGDFEQAITEAQAIIDDDESQAQTQQLLLFGGAAVVLLAVLGGGYYAYSQRKKNTNKLQ